MDNHLAQEGNSLDTGSRQPFACRRNTQLLGFVELCTEKRRPKSINRFYPLKEK
ncbi:hypothetical protein O8J47_27330 [Pseudomonas aeruginosa]|uniref:hypothetical protein n=1 Tax=Pseudomonas aeruginosa TaxID=287 RepID=UPI0022B6A4C1|nr:hypothetical protein [Pseudomonas aeruginosa]MCZ7726513.1 hypothetical protein [Pseudomonas aeruginosa]MCZ7732969.1 hypothetical protein [Pseudomonas aeruginosa]